MQRVKAGSGKKHNKVGVTNDVLESVAPVILETYDGLVNIATSLDKYVPPHLTTQRGGLKKIYLVKGSRL